MYNILYCITQGLQVGHEWSEFKIFSCKFSEMLFLKLSAY